MWTFWLLSTGIAGMWLSARHWWGWLISAGSEGLWMAYALKTHDHALFLMAIVYFVVNARNARRTWKDRHEAV